MARIARSSWIDVVVSKYGPLDERDRHVCHALYYRMRGDGSEGCFPGQRDLAQMMSITHRTVAASLERLRQNGWLETEQRRRQYGKIGYVYFPAIPETLVHQLLGNRDSPITLTNGEQWHPQLAMAVDKLSTNGESKSGIGESRPKIGEPGLPRSLTETKLKRGNAAPAAQSGAAAAIRTPLESAITRLAARAKP